MDLPHLQWSLRVTLDLQQEHQRPRPLVVQNGTKSAFTVASSSQVWTLSPLTWPIIVRDDLTLPRHPADRPQAVAATVVVLGLPLRILKRALLVLLTSVTPVSVNPPPHRLQVGFKGNLQKNACHYEYYFTLEEREIKKICAILELTFRRVTKLRAQQWSQLKILKKSSTVLRKRKHMKRNRGANETVNRNGEN